jgi:HEAT repeat protein
MKTNYRRFLSASIALSVTALVSVSSAADPSTDPARAGRSSVYSNLSDSSLEAVSTPAAILSLVRAPSSAAPTAIWTMLEHGERVECLGCIPYVGKMLFDANPKTREISAWWLRRRIFGVFGPGQVYQQIVTAVTDQTQPEANRAYAASALGEFLEGAGIAPVSQALTTDGSAVVRLAAANALIRLNNQGPNAELGAALADADEGVRLAALSGATHINVFTAIDKVAGLLSDPSAAVRRRAAETLGSMKIDDAVVGLIAVTSPANESNAGVRAAAVWALGQIADTQARNAVLAAQNDTNSGVQDAAGIALLRL